MSRYSRECTKKTRREREKDRRYGGGVKKKKTLAVVEVASLTQQQPRERERRSAQEKGETKTHHAHPSHECLNVKIGGSGWPFAYPPEVNKRNVTSANL